jgi:hypothetical protein
MIGYGNAWPKSFYERTVQTGIGRVIAEQIDVSGPLPETLGDLIKRLEGLDPQRGEPQGASH